MGSTVALTDNSGNTLERNAYDPYGKRRTLTGGTDTGCTLTSATTRGFSGHEMIDSMCLTDMNARMYDQTMGRFLSADSMDFDPGNGQDLNPYAYVDGQPTVFTDLTGHGYETVVVDGTKIVGGDILGTTGGSGSPGEGSGSYTEIVKVFGKSKNGQMQLEGLQIYTYGGGGINPNIPGRQDASGIENLIVIAFRQYHDISGPGADPDQNGNKGNDNDKQPDKPACPSKGALMVYQLGGAVGEFGGKTTTYSALSALASLPIADTGVGFAGLLAAGAGATVGEYLSIAGTGLQLGSAAWIYAETGDWVPAMAVGVPAALGAVKPLDPLIGSSVSDAMQNYIESHSPALRCSG